MIARYNKFVSRVTVSIPGEDQSDQPAALTDHSSDGWPQPRLLEGQGELASPPNMSSISALLKVGNC